MKTIKQLYAYLNEKIPSSLSCGWDNDGLMVSGDLDSPCEKVLLSLDVTKDTAAYALAGRFSLIISHHPLIFKPLKSLNTLDFVSDKAVRLIKGRVSVFSFHTRLDALDKGVNDALAHLLGINDPEPFVSDGELLGKMGNLSQEIEPEKLAKLVKDVLYCPYVSYVEGEKKKIGKIVVVGGDGKDYIRAAYDSGADAYITGGMSYNTMLDAYDMGMCVIEAGHFESEVPVLKVIDKFIKEFDKDILTEYYYSNPIKTI